MRLSQALIFAGALFVATPVIAQDNAAAPGNDVASNAAEANTGAAVSNTPAPPTENATVAPTETTTTETTNTTSTAPAPKGFPWGVLGLLGLIGLFGVRKVKG
jgi:hypothetical protein